MHDREMTPESRGGNEVFQMDQAQNIVLLKLMLKEYQNFIRGKESVHQQSRFVGEQPNKYTAYYY